MRWLIETIDGDTFEVTNLFNEHGLDVTALEQATVCVIKFAVDEWAQALIENRKVHPVH